jgi:hypothetical protein
MVRALVEVLENAGRLEALAQHYVSLLARPNKNPLLLVRLAERIEGQEHGLRLAPPK